MLKFVKEGTDPVLGHYYIYSDDDNKKTYRVFLESGYYKISAVPGEAFGELIEKDFFKEVTSPEVIKGIFNIKK